MKEHRRDRGGLIIMNKCVCGMGRVVQGLRRAEEGAEQQGGEDKANARSRDPNTTTGQERPGRLGQGPAMGPEPLRMEGVPQMVRQREMWRLPA